MIKSVYRVSTIVLALFSLLALMSVYVESAWGKDVTGTVSSNAYGNSGVNINVPDGPDQNDNTLIIKSGGSVSGLTYGAYHNSLLSTTGNSVIVETGGSARIIYGAYVFNSTSGPLEASYNTVRVDIAGNIGGTVYGGNVDSYGGFSAVADNNTVVFDGTMTGYGDITGGRARSTSTGSASLNSITVGNGANLNGGSIRGGDVEGTNTTGDASNNTITVADGNNIAMIQGGYVYDSSDANVTHNTITIIDGNEIGTIYGGYVFSSANVEATDNTVTIMGGTFTNGAQVFGGYFAIGTGDVYSRNTFNLHSPITLQVIYNFENLNFFLPSTMAAGGTMLTVYSADLTDGGSGLAKVNVGIEGSSSPLRMGDEVILIDATAGSLIVDQVTGSADGTGMAGVTLQYGFGIRVESNKLIAKVTVGPSASPRAKPISEGFLAGLALAGQVADLAAGQGMAEAATAARRAERQGTGSRTGLAVFAAIHGGKIKYYTGSHMKLASFSVMAGLSRGADLPPGRLTLGVFAEYGNGSYDTYNSFSDSAAVHGGGEVTYAGAGILGRMDFSEWRSGSFYAEASFRAGHARNEFSSGDLRDASGRAASYDSSSSYYGMHAGFGRSQRLGDAALLDVYVKSFWTRQEGDEVRLSTGDIVRFEDADSTRLRLGGRLSLASGGCATPYFGVAWEREFDGNARAFANGFAIEEPSLRGWTGIGEIGVTFVPSSSLPISLDIGVQGYAGKREGVTGSIDLKIEF
jgi:hypothetical protein